MVKHTWNRGKALLIMLALLGPASTVESVPVAGDRGNVSSEKKPTEKTELERLRRHLRKQAEELQRYKSAEYQIDLEYFKKYHDYLAEKAEVNLAQFIWQTRAAENLMWLVVAVVLAGVVYSGVQMWRGGTADSKVEITAQNIKMTSSVVGAVVLVISVLFFYFFLTKVYPITIVDVRPSETPPTIGTSRHQEAEKTTE